MIGFSTEPQKPPHFLAPERRLFFAPLKAAWRNLREDQADHDKEYQLTAPERPCWGEWAVRNHCWPTQEQHGSISYRETAPLSVPIS